MATVKESSTGTLFPTSLKPPGSAASLTLLGTGVREKKILMVTAKIYAAAAYVDAAAATTALSSFKGQAGKKLEKDEAFFSAIVNGAFDLSVALSFVRDITADQFSNGIKESVEPKMKAKGAPADSITKFMAALASCTCSPGSRIYLTLSHPAKLTVSSTKATDVPTDLSVPESSASSVVECEKLCLSLREVYFSKETAVPSLRTNAANHAASTLLK